MPPPVRARPAPPRAAGGAFVAAAWAAGPGAALLALQGRVDTSAVRFSADTRRFQVPRPA